jgi:hypothetical protein
VHVALRNRIGRLKQAVGQGAFTMVNMSYYAEISDSVHPEIVLQGLKILRKYIEFL